MHRFPSRRNNKRLFTTAASGAPRFYEKNFDRTSIMGAIAIQWSAIEWHLFNIFMFMVPVDRRVAETLFYSYGTHKTRRTVVKNLIEHMIDDEVLKKHLASLLDGMKKCADRRNELTHDLWVVDSKTNETHLMKAGYVPLGKDDISNIAFRGLKDFHRKMYRLNNKLDFATLMLATNGPRSLQRHLKKHAARKTAT